MNPFLRARTPAQASAELGVSPKALRLYEKHGLLVPDRTRTGWRAYDADAMKRAAEIVALRALGLGFGQIARALGGDAGALDAGLAAHEIRLSQHADRTATALASARLFRARLAQGGVSASAKPGVAAREAPPIVAFALPWPWNGEWFALPDMPRLTFITGPLGSGKTRFAQRLAAEVPDAAFLGLDRVADPALAQRLAEDPSFAERVERRLARLVDGGAERSAALSALVAALEVETPTAIVVDMVEEGLSAATQRALMVELRLRRSATRSLFLMTRSSSILDLDALGPAEAVILCPANHGAPFHVVPRPGGRGYEATATCVAAPDVRARTQHGAPAALRSEPVARTGSEAHR